MVLVKKVRVKKVPATTNNITQAIVNLLIIEGWSASRINTTGVYREEINAWTKGGAREGFSDIAACIGGVFVAIEVKRKYKNGKDRKRTAQKEFQIEVEHAGGIYFVSENYEDFNKWYFDNKHTFLALNRWINSFKPHMKL